MPQFLSGANIPISDWTFFDFLGAYWRYGNENIPFVGPLWFIRNLMVLVIISPIIYIYILKFQKFGILILGIIWILGFREFSIPGSMALFFFGTGAYFGIFKIDFAQIFGKITLSYLYPLLLICDVFSKNWEYNEYLHRITVVLGIVFFVKMVISLLSKYAIKLAPILAASSFFIYAFHEPYYDQIRKVLFRFILPLSKDAFILDIQMSIYYILIPIIYTFILVIIYFLLFRYLPRIASILSGGR